MSVRSVVPYVPVAIFLAACAGTPPKAAPIDVVLADYAITAPASIPASMATFNVTNKGQEAHHAALVRLDSGKTYADFQAAMKMEGKAPPPSWIVWLGGAQAFPGASGNVTMPLEPGNYVWYCVIPSADGMPHVMKGMSAPMTVTASTGPVDAAPEADVVVTMKDYGFDFSTPPTAGKHIWKISGTPGNQVHEAVLVRLAPGKTAKDFTDWVEKMAGPPPVESLNGVPVLQPGYVNYQSVDLTPGNYAMVCFVPDMTDGKSHSMHGMVKEFSVQ